MTLYWIDENKINPALHIHSWKLNFGTKILKIMIFFYHFPKETEFLLLFCKLKMIFELQGANNKSLVNNIPLEGYEIKIGMHGPWLFLRGILGKGLHVMVTFFVSIPIYCVSLGCKYGKIIILIDLLKSFSKLVL